MTSPAYRLILEKKRQKKIVGEQKKATAARNRVIKSEFSQTPASKKPKKLPLSEPIKSKRTMLRCQSNNIRLSIKFRRWKIMELNNQHNPNRVLTISRSVHRLSQRKLPLCEEIKSKRILLRSLSNNSRMFLLKIVHRPKIMVLNHHHPNVPYCLANDVQHQRTIQISFLLVQTKKNIRKRIKV